MVVISPVPLHIVPCNLIYPTILPSCTQILTPLPALGSKTTAEPFHAGASTATNHLRPALLLEPDPDAPLDLGRAIAACYERGGYDIINYTHNAPPPKLAKEDVFWLDQRLRQQGIR